MSNNKSPEEQAAYAAQLKQQIAMADAEVARLQAIKQSHQDQVTRYINFETAHPLFKKMVDYMIAETTKGTAAIDAQISEYLNYKAQYVQEMRSVNPDFKP